ncbi:hypothetical protein PREVCOP_06437 [Segatella copri DSM 18205]|uniref:Uncharacterized protein n=1 Tax=Segatella copri DSM 18205 TaxID=537011 RepID=D1PGS2_9BACT|nr:hypothetical protein PREVCOP_06437 [Segatella copri DSM 18205]
MNHHALGEDEKLVAPAEVGFLLKDSVRKKMMLPRAHEMMEMMGQKGILKSS